MWLLPLFKTIFTSLGRKAPTHNYPRVPIPKDPTVRGSIAIEIETCIFCTICARKCPTDAIVVDRAKKELELSRFECIVCAACIDACPKKSIKMLPELDSPSHEKTTEKYTASAVTEDA